MILLHALISGVMWPPGYYILRDRIPFFLTILYLYKSKLSWFGKINQARLGLVLMVETAAVSLVALYLYFTEDSMIKLVGFNWSAPSPIQWGVFITVSTLLLVRKNIPIFEAYYLTFITALGGAWIYEFAPMLFNGFDWFVFFKVNAVKVFFLEFQVFCLPIVLYLIKTRYDYTTSKWLIPSGVFAFLFAAFNPYIISWVQQNLIYAYRWYVRLPTIFFLFFALIGIQGEKKQ